MSSLLHAIGTAVPPHIYTRDYAKERMRRWTTDRLTRRLIGSIVENSDIAQRHSVLPDLLPGASPLLFTEETDGIPREPSTAARNRVFAQQAPALAHEATLDAFARTGLSPADVTHLVTVSCTGFSNPGWDLDLVRSMGLRSHVERYHLGFMGCYAAFPALRMADQFCRAHPDAVVLVVCVELCTLHLQIRPDPDNLLANALFADGAGAAIVVSDQRAAGGLRMHGFLSSLAPEGRAEMAWEIGDHGFDIRLSTYVPEIIGRNLRGVLDGLFAGRMWGIDTIGDWAVHPGGRAILDKVEQEFGLMPDQLAAARLVLRDYGNMSSATILFVLQQLMRRPDDAGRPAICAMAFGPGLTIESALMERIPARTTGHVVMEKPHALPAPV